MKTWGGVLDAMKDMVYAEALKTATSAVTNSSIVPQRRDDFAPIAAALSAGALVSYASACRALGLNPSDLEDDAASAPVTSATCHRCGGQLPDDTSKRWYGALALGEPNVDWSYVFCAEECCREAYMLHEIHVGNAPDPLLVIDPRFLNLAGLEERERHKRDGVVACRYCQRDMTWTWSWQEHRKVMRCELHGEWEEVQ